MTEPKSRTDETRTATATNMKAVDHTHPDTDRPFGEQVVFARGPAVAADGGERSQGDRERHRAQSDGSEPSEVEDDDHDADEEQMKDVDHEPPNETESNRVFERGREGRDDTR